MIIDAHVHIFPPEVIRRREEYFADAGFAALYSSPKARITDAEGLLAAMDESGIDAAFVMGFPWHDKSFCSEQNAYFAEVQQRYAGRLYCFGSVPIRDADSVLQTAENIKAAGLAGIGEAAFYGGMDGNAKEMLQILLSAAEANRLPLCLHVNEPVGHIYPGKYEPRLNFLYEAISAHPQARVILAHWGGGMLFYELMPEVKRSLANVFYDTAASPFIYDEGIWNAALGIVGRNKILLGTDYPLLPFRRLTEEAKQAIADEDALQAVLGGNALAFIQERSG